MLHIDSGELLVIVHNTVKQNQVSSVDIKVQEGFDVASVLSIVELQVGKMIPLDQSQELKVEIR